MRIFLCLAALSLALFSCSKLSVGVYWADTFALSQLDDYFLLDGAQSAAAKEEFRSAFKEVRRLEFLPLAGVLEGIAGEVERNELTLARLEHWSQVAVAILKKAALRFEPLGQQIVAQQAKTGFGRFDEEFTSAHEKRGKKLSSPKDRLKQAKKRIERVVGETIGSLNSEQEALVEETLKENPLLLEHENRARLFEKFKAARGDALEREKFLRRYFQDWDSLQGEDYLKARDAYQKNSRALMIRLLEGASAAQKEHLTKNFRKRAEELRKLAVVD